MRFRKGQWVRYIGPSTIVFDRYVGQTLYTRHGLVHVDLGRPVACAPGNLEKLTRAERIEAIIDIAKDALGIEEEEDSLS